MVWRIAATVMVVAAGTLVVFRSQNNEVRSEASTADTAMTLSASTSATAAPMTVLPAPRAAPGNVSGAVLPAPPVATAQTMRRAADLSAASNGEKRGEVKSPPDVPLTQREFNAAGQNRLSAKVAVPEVAAAAPPAPSLLAAPRMADAAMMDRATTADSLKVVGRPRRLGARVTVYEIAPGDTVTLTESVSIALESIVVTGAGTTTQMAPQAAGKASAAAPRREPTRPTNAPDSQPASAAISGSVAGSPAPSGRVGMLGGLNSISWVDPATGATLTLSGRVSEARLQQARFKIERERAAAAARKNPQE